MRTLGIALLALAVPTAALAQEHRGWEGGGRFQQGRQGAQALPVPPQPSAPPQTPQPPQPRDAAPAREQGRGFAGADRFDPRGGPDAFQARPDGGRRFDDRGRGLDHRADDRGPDFDRRADDRGPGFAGRPDGRLGGPRGDGRPGPDRAWRPGYDWRADRSFDWRGYRDRNRAAFSIGRYYAPRGWAGGYRRFGVGYRLPGFFYAQTYWLADPWEYRLPPAYGPYRWIRYYDDVLLVDLRTGRVVDAIPDFFF